MFQFSTALIALNPALNTPGLNQLLINSKVRITNRIPVNTKEGIIPEIEFSNPNLLFISSNLTGAIEITTVIGKVKQISPRTKIILIVNESNVTQIVNYFTDNIDGIIWEKNFYENIEPAIRQLQREFPFMCGKTIQELKSNLLQKQNQPLQAEPGLLENLTDREVEVLSSLTKGTNYKQISKTLFISESTVKTHINNIFTKLNVNDRTQAVLYALRHGIENAIKKPSIIRRLNNEQMQL